MGLPVQLRGGHRRPGRERRHRPAVQQRRDDRRRRDAATPRETIPRTAAEKAFEKRHAAPAAGCAGSADEYCGAIFGFWPGPVVADPARHRVLFTYGKLCRGGRAGTPCSGALGKGLGMGIAALDMTSGAVTRLAASGGPAVGSVEGTDPTADPAAASSG